MTKNTIETQNGCQLEINHWGNILKAKYKPE